MNTKQIFGKIPRIKGLDPDFVKFFMCPDYGDQEPMLSWTQFGEIVETTSIEFVYIRFMVI